MRIFTKSDMLKIQKKTKKGNFIGNIEKIKRIHTCSNCLREFEWDQFCAWYGSIENVEIKACSCECQRDLNKKINKKHDSTSSKEKVVE